ncbi:hypothetical protein GE061_000727 [Apolygus lucorum]|uniref:Uncharacterized protein n=1 Tax=Apolygus lucorum TaxID=248454 RepID=A0A8S9YA09_APOLU|nr:hypothetical protein GE061_000727 [Apolygus lucorum]
MERDVGRAKKKIKVVPKARKAFQVKYEGQPLPLEFVVATREKFEKFIVTNNLLRSCEEEYLEVLEKKFTSSKEVDVKSKDGHMVLKWAAFSSVDKMFFFGDDLLCLMNGSYVQVIENVDSTNPKHKTWNLFNAHSAAELIEGNKSPRSFTIQAVAGCPYTPTIAYVISNSPIIHIMTYPQMSRMASLRSFNEMGDYIELHFGIGECLYGLRGHPGNVVEVWSLRSRSILVSIPGSFYSNRAIMKLSPISYTMVTIDKGCQDVVRWTLHCASPSDLLAYPQAVNLVPVCSTSIVDASFTHEDDLYLLTHEGEIYYHFKVIRKAYCELESVTTIGDDPKVAINSRASFFKIGTLVRDTTLIAVLNAEGLSTAKWNIEMLGAHEEFKGLIRDVTMMRHHVIAVERRRILVIGLEDGIMESLKEVSKASIISSTQEGLEALNLYVRRYRDLFEDKNIGKSAQHRRPYPPGIVKGVREYLYNFYKSSATVIEEASARGILLYCTDLVTISYGFERCITPRWFRNAGPAAELTALTVHARKRGADEDFDRQKLDLNKKISEAVQNFAAHFIKGRKSQIEESADTVLEEDDRTDNALIRMETALGADADIFIKKEIENIGGTAAIESAPEEGVNVDSGDESSNGDQIPDASNDGTEEERLSTDSCSSGSTFDLPCEEDFQPGVRSSYLIRLLERKEAKKSRKFEMKDGMLKCYNHFSANVKAFITKFHGSSSHEFLHIFPLCFTPDETDSVFTNHQQFLCSRQDFEGESARFTIEPLKPISPLMIPLESPGFRQLDDCVQRPLDKIEICPAVWKGSDKLSSLVEWVSVSE